VKLGHIFSTILGDKKTLSTTIYSLEQAKPALSPRLWRLLAMRFTPSFCKRYQPYRKSYRRNANNIHKKLLPQNLVLSA
jgi:hypothetical protein